jgi:dTDP-4-dehydrorhamnose 3,5-epimerase
MIFSETPLAGAFVIELEPFVDERGSFARTFDADEFALRGLNAAVVQCNVSLNTRRGTLRGMHYQADPYGECKLVRCTRGSIFDVIVDVRKGSPTRCGWFGVELTESNGRMLFIPEGVAHGFQTLTDSAEVHYQMSQVYIPEASRGVRWNDPAFGIDWPDGDRVISDKDQRYPDYPR